MVSPTHPPTAPISSEGSTMFLSPDRDLSPGSPDLGGHTPAVPDRPGSPRHLDHPGSQIPRLQDKFKPAPSS
uniref:Uncharacterized protein n=2 Tax=Peronospora matthiolae TaxID=2874970 RepID=A0AAV1UQ43_9STRA